ncbi:hypothetical protein EYB45_04020 [Erythrobacteraceae bacterium CFH 75059]|uniref:DUF6127 family protein n=1 Tax=Qipengyuania thermophila TaxID=2509361 RepID=UPI00101EE4AA|nr:DUF6127 family protein [Qipengyuania thermophila]TCD06850.1 hypothetical protein EYB45_04020 [Erythrobacteraceae bacterium CFH 75059]
MNRTDLLTQLLAQSCAAAGGDRMALRAIVEEASEVGAERALARLGLADEGAQDDIDELRELLGAWRDAKASAWKATVDWLVRGLLALLLIGIAMRMGVPELLR